MLDLDTIKAQADLLAICERDTPLKRVASTHGGEYAGPCPFCGGRDRFRVQPNARPFPLWMCRQCAQARWDTVIGYIARRDRLDPTRRADLAEICRRAGGTGLETRLAPQARPAPTPAYAPPDPDWQAAARQVVAECETALWQPQYRRALDYLRGRGLNDDTLRHFRVGYCATGQAERCGREIAGLYVPRGLVMPCIAAEQIWYLKIRLLPGVPCACQHCKTALPGPGACPACGRDTRYLGVRGNKTSAIFNADELARPLVMALFCEGEIDCMTAYQEFNMVMPTVTFGGAANHPDLSTWGHYLLPLRSLLISYDTDLPGQKGAEWLQTISNRVRLAPLPAGFKDINEYHCRGGDLLDWIVNYQAFYIHMD